MQGLNNFLDTCLSRLHTWCQMHDLQIVVQQYPDARILLQG